MEEKRYKLLTKFLKEFENIYFSFEQKDDLNKENMNDAKNLFRHY